MSERPQPPAPAHPADDPHDAVVAWRVFRLREAGFEERLAWAVAGDCGYDVHALLDLADRGCPPELAARILAPLDGEHRPC
jgi:hypothetical protein